LDAYTNVYAGNYPIANDLKNIDCFPINGYVDGMLEETPIEHSLDIKRPLAIRALRRSNTRKRIAEYLFEISPNCSYTSEIAYHIGATSSNVIGALRGMKSRYKEDESLIGLDLVEERSGGKNLRFYALTSFGKDILEEIKSR
jgi:predicted transcriptional regulator with HTH domain